MGTFYLDIRRVRRINSIQNKKPEKKNKQKCLKPLLLFPQLPLLQQYPANLLPIKRPLPPKKPLPKNELPLLKKRQSKLPKSRPNELAKLPKSSQSCKPTLAEKVSPLKPSSKN